MGTLIPQSDLDLDKVRHMANKAQKIFNFTLADPIETIGDADEDGQYKFSNIARILKSTRCEQNINVLVGIIDSPIRDELYSGIDEDFRCIIISLTDIDHILERSKKSYTDYVLSETAAQLLAIEYRRAEGISADPEACAPPWHRETKSCLFDYDENRDQTYKKLMLPQLCVTCKALMTEANVGESIQTACVKIVKAGIRPIRTAMRETIHNKFVWGLTGVLLGGTLFNHPSAPPLKYVIIAIGSIILLVFIRYYRKQFIKF